MEKRVVYYILGGAAVFMFLIIIVSIILLVKTGKEVGGEVKIKTFYGNLNITNFSLKKDVAKIVIERLSFDETLSGFKLIFGNGNDNFTYLNYTLPAISNQTTYEVDLSGKISNVLFVELYPLVFQVPRQTPINDTNQTQNQTVVYIKFYRDFDGDGYGNSSDFQYFLLNEINDSVYNLTILGDCDDENKSINPDAEEVCDGADNDCNHAVDEGCYCTGSPIGFCSQYSGLKNSTGTQCLDAGCSVYEKWCSGADINQDGIVNETDLIEVGRGWNKIGCNYTAWAVDNGTGSDWCNKVDINQDGDIGNPDNTAIDRGWSATGCNFPENIFADCYSTARCLDFKSKGSCKETPGCSWGKDVTCGEDSDCPEKNCYEPVCNEDKTCEQKYAGGSGCVGCGTIVSQDNAIITLNNDLLNCETFGIMINAANVVLDCNNHEITGSSKEEFYDSKGKQDCSLNIAGFGDQIVYPSGVVVCRNKGKAYHIKNCIIHENFDKLGEYHVNYGGAITIYDEYFNENEKGIIENNYIYNVDQGIMHWGEADIIQNNKFENNRIGIWLDESSGDLIKGNEFKNCEENAIWHYCGASCDYKGKATNITGNTFTKTISSGREFYLKTSYGGLGWGGNGLINDNIIQNTFIKQNQGLITFDGLNIKLYFENNLFNSQPLNPREFVSEDKISNVAF